MSDVIAAAIISSAGLIVVALITLLRQWWADRRVERAKVTEDRLNRNDVLFDEYGELIDRKNREIDRLDRELEQERADKRRIRTERDTERRLRLHCEEQWDRLTLNEERGSERPDRP